MLTDILAYHLLKFPFLLVYFDFFRDFLIFFQISFISLFVIFKKPKSFFLYLLIFIFGFILAQFFKTFFPSLRPISFYFPEPQLFDSFPSRHTLISFALSLALTSQNFRLGIFSLALTILIAIFSWLSLMHWPIDILAGFFLGFIVFVISKEILYLFHWFYFRKFQNKT